MIRLRTARIAALSLAVGLVAACTNNPNRADISLLRDLPQLLGAGQREPVRITPQMAAQALLSTPDPLTFVALEDTGTQTLMLEIERNGAYRTYSSPARQVVVFRGGMATSTRGLSGDIMSTESGPLLAALAAGGSSTAPYTMRFLTPEDVTRSIDFTCVVTPGGQFPLPAFFDTRQVARTATADCNTPGLRVTSVFALAADGGVLAARQWFGPTLGHATYAVLRR